MHFIGGLIILLLLALVFPRAAMIALGLISVSAFLLFAQCSDAEQRRALLRSRVAVTASYDPQRCGQTNPVLLVFKNGTAKTVSAITFELSGKVPGYSSEIFAANSFFSDKIMGPADVYEACWHPPHMLRTTPLASLAITIKTYNVTFD